MVDGKPQSTFGDRHAATEALAFEIFYPVILGLRWKWRRGFYVALAITLVFQVSVYILMGVNFMFYFALLPIWSDRWIDSRLSSS